MLSQRQRRNTLTNQNDKCVENVHTKTVCVTAHCRPCGKLMCMHRACMDIFDEMLKKCIRYFLHIHFFLLLIVNVINQSQGTLKHTD